MPDKKDSKKHCVEAIRHSEYYSMQETFDDLYSRSHNGEMFENLMELILCRENILLAYRNLKTNSGSYTQGTDGLTIRDIGKLTAEEVVDKVRFILMGSKHGYRPRNVRRKEIPKPYDCTKTRPLGIPCIWDRLIQQCFKQIMEPICEAKFSNNSYGFRPNRSVENAIAATYYRIQRSKLHYVIEFDIKGFFDNVNHTKLIRQIWAMGIHDKVLIDRIKRMIKAPIKMPDGEIVTPAKGTPQGSIISPLLANIVLNELDHWIESQWQENPIVRKYAVGIDRRGAEIHSAGYAAMRKTNLKEMYIVRYADDFRIFCKTKTDAVNTKIAVTKWLRERLKLEVSEEKTKITNVRKSYSDFLGFKIKVRPKADKYVVVSHISDKQFERRKANLVEQAKHIARPRDGKTAGAEIRLYNSMVVGMQEYYDIATDISLDCKQLNRAVMTILTNRLGANKGSKLIRKGRELTKFEKEKYGASKMLRFEAETHEPIYPIGYVRCKKPMQKRRRINAYTVEGRKGLHDNLEINTSLMTKLMRADCRGNAEYADNRISLFSAQWGKCAITNQAFTTTEEIHCHHIKPKTEGGSDKYENLVLVLESVHKLIHATHKDTIRHYLEMLKLEKKQLQKLNALREKVGLETIA